MRGGFRCKRLLKWPIAEDFGLALILLLWIGIGWQLATEHDWATKSAREEVRNLARVLERNVSRSISELDLILRLTRERYLKNWREFDANALRQLHVLQDGNAASKLAFQMAILDRDGILQTTTVSPPPATVVNLSDREHFKVHATGDRDELFISRPIVGRASRKPAIQFTRRIGGPSGSFEGVAVLSADPEQLLQAVSSVALQTGSFIALVGQDGVVRTSVGGNIVKIGADLSATTMFQAWTHSGAVDGAFNDSTTTDGRERLIAFQKVESSPLAVFVGMEHANIYRAYFKNRMRYIFIGGVLTVLIVVAMVAATRRRRKLLHVNKALAAAAGNAHEATSLLRREVEERKSAELALMTKGERLLAQQRVLSVLIKSGQFRNGTLAQALARVTEASALAVAVERTSVWIFNATRDAIRCVDLFERTLGRHSDGYELNAVAFPRYFHALAHEEDIAADDARCDPRTRDFAAGPLFPHGVTSMLHAPISRNGRVEGVICFEHVGAPISWSPEQRLFAVEMASLAVLVIESQERLRVEEDLRAANRSLELATQAKSRFLANMSHEIRTPMNGVFGMTDLLMGTELSDQQRRLVGTINDSTKTLLKIINDILDLSRIEAGKFELDQREFCLRSCLEGAVELFADEAQRKGLELTLFAADDLPQLVEGDAGRLRQVCINLICNAVKFTQAGEVSIRATYVDHVDRPLARLAIRDTGIGMDPLVKAQLFQPFMQADSSISRRFGGTGLGLAISRHLVALMGGDIQIDSEVGSGTTIVVSLPLKLASGSPSSVPLSGIERLRGANVLVVGSHGGTCEMMREHLTWKGAKVACVEPAEAADALRGLAAGQSFPVVILDATMRGDTDLDRLKVLRSDPLLGAAKFVVAARMGSGADRKIMELGAPQLTKPVRRAELLDAVANALGEAQEAPAKSSFGASAPPARMFKAKVLLAEDNPINVLVAKEVIARLGCSFEVARDGVEALAAFKRGPFDVILMDCQMPLMDGITASRKVREIEAQNNLRRVPIIAVTANAFSEDRDSCLAAGMDDHLSKPFTVAELAGVLAKWLQLADAQPAADGDAPPALRGRGEPHLDAARMVA